MTARRQFPPPRAPLALLAARAAAGIGAVHGSGIDHSWKPKDHKLPTRAFIHQEAHLALPSNCLNDPDHLILIEPTETEPIEELDAFVDAMIAIRDEAAKDANILKDAPHGLPVSRLDEVRAVKELDLGVGGA